MQQFLQSSQLIFNVHGPKSNSIILSTDDFLIYIADLLCKGALLAGPKKGFVVLEGA